MRFDIHGVGLELVCPAPEVADAIGRRLTDFEAQSSPEPLVRFVYDLVGSPSDHTVGRPTGSSRPVYDPPIGEVTYFPERDALYIEPDESVRVLCDGATSTARVSLTEAALGDLWLLSRPLFTLPLMELLKRRGLYSVHAAAVAAEGRGVLFAGATGSGKSTLALAHAERGFSLLGDDLVFLRPATGSVTALAFRDEIDLTEETVSWFPSLSGVAEPIPPGWRKHRVRPEALAAPYEPHAVPVAVIFPTPVAATSAVEPVSRAEALTELVPNVLLTDPAASQLHLDALGALVGQAACYRLVAGRDFDRIAALVRDVCTDTSPDR